METTVYQMLITNTAAYIRGEKNKKQKLTGNGIDAFMASSVLAIALAMDKETVIKDLIAAKV